MGRGRASIPVLLVRPRVVRRILVLTVSFLMLVILRITSDVAVRCFMLVLLLLLLLSKVLLVLLLNPISIFTAATNVFCVQLIGNDIIIVVVVGGRVWFPNRPQRGVRAQIHAKQSHEVHRRHENAHDQVRQKQRKHRVGHAVDASVAQPPEPTLHERQHNAARAQIRKLARNLRKQLVQHADLHARRRAHLVSDLLKRGFHVFERLLQVLHRRTRELLRNVVEVARRFLRAVAVCKAQSDRKVGCHVANVACCHADNDRRGEEDPRDDEWQQKQQQRAHAQVLAARHRVARHEQRAKHRERNQADDDDEQNQRRDFDHVGHRRERVNDVARGGFDFSRDAERGERQILQKLLEFRGRRNRVDSLNTEQYEVLHLAREKLKHNKPDRQHRDDCVGRRHNPIDYDLRLLSNCVIRHECDRRTSQRALNKEHGNKALYNTTFLGRRRPKLVALVKEIAQAREAHDDHDKRRK
mmetsp:Transcript_10916/g.23320  ORF Transcript_10916/g.23320 Transcript_10916/m.23320 type:complete len:470 (-) Transcript_10916:459-1868(-)